jgi:cation transport ATPase
MTAMTQRENHIRLSPRHLLILHLVACILVVSGGAAALQDILDSLGQDHLLPMSFKSWALAVHGGAAMIFLVLLGTLLPTHVVRAWRSGRNRLSGVALLVAIGLLVVSGYGLYYFGGDRLRSVTQWTHLGLGILEPILFIMHLILGRRTRPAAA